MHPLGGAGTSKDYKPAKPHLYTATWSLVQKGEQAKDPPAWISFTEILYWDLDMNATFQTPKWDLSQWSAAS